MPYAYNRAHFTKLPGTIPALLALTFAFSPGTALGDGGSQGGSNSQNIKGQQKVIDALSYDDPDQDLIGYAEFRERLKFLREVAPDLADKLEKKLPDLEWYRVKGPLDLVDKSKTGLDMQTDQDAYQLPSGQIYLDTDLRDKMEAEYKTSRAAHAQDPEVPVSDSPIRQVAHENFMSLLEIKNSDQVRSVVRALFSKKADPDLIRKKLVLNHFGAYLSRAQVEAIRQVVFRDYQNLIAHQVDEGNFICHSITAKESDPKSVKWNWDFLRSYMANTSAGSRPKGSPPGFEKFNSPFCHQGEKDHFNGWEKAFNPHGNFKDNIAEWTKLALGKSAPELAGEACSVQDPTAKEQPEAKLRAEACAALAAHFDVDGFEKQFAQERRKLSQNADFMAILALTCEVSAAHVSSLREDDKNPYLAGVEKEEEALSADVAGKQKLTARTSLPEKMKSLCAHIEALRGVLVKSKAGEAEGKRVEDGESGAPRGAADPAPVINSKDAL